MDELQMILDQVGQRMDALHIWTGQQILNVYPIDTKLKCNLDGVVGIVIGTDWNKTKKETALVLLTAQRGVPRKVLLCDLIKHYSEQIEQKPAEENTFILENEV